MAWIEITEADVLTVLSGTELTGYRTAALGIGQVDPVDPTIDQVTDLVRGYVAGSGRYTLGSVGIPGKLLAPALDLIAFRIPGRVGETPTESRRIAAESAIKLLEQVAKGFFGIEEPTVPSTESVSIGSPAITSKTLTYQRDDEDGL